MGRIENEEYKIDKERKRRNRERLKNEIKVDLKKEIEYDLLSEFRIKFKKELKEELRKEIKEELKKEIILELKIENIRTKEIQEKIGSRNRKSRVVQTPKEENNININNKKENTPYKMKEELKDDDEKLISDFLGFADVSSNINHNNKENCKEIERTEVMSENDVTAYMDRTMYLNEMKKNNIIDEDYFFEEEETDEKQGNIITENIKKTYRENIEELKNSEYYNKCIKKIKRFKK